MPDREKVIKAIETHLSTDISVGCDDCTYENDGWCTTRVLADALTLLKEQEHKDRMFQALEDDWKRLKELLKEQEAETELCERCGRVRLKSKWEGR